MDGFNKIDAPLQCVRIIQPLKDLNRSKMEEGRFYSLFPFYFNWISHVIFCCPWTGVYIIPSGPLALRHSDSDWNYTTGFSGPPPCRQHIVGLLSFHNCMSQFSIINLSISKAIYTAIYLAGSVSLENSNARF